MDVTNTLSGRFARALRENWIETALAVVTALSSIPFASKFLYHIDSAQYALGMRHYSIIDYQPHPSGYPVYVFLGKALDLVMPDANGALVALSVIFACVGVAALYRLALAMTGHRAASASAALFLVFNPLFWFYREVALNYTSEMMTHALTGLLVYRIAFEGRKGLFPVLALVLAFSFGIRPSIFMVAPVALFAVLYVRNDREGFAWRRILLHLDYRCISLGAAVFAAGVLAWLVPVIYMTGGFAVYYSLLDNFWQAALRTTSFFQAPREIFIQQFKYYYRTLAVAAGAAFPMMAAGAAVVLTGRGTPRDAAGSTAGGGRLKTASFFLLWCAPAFLTYTLGHFGQAGYHLSLAPALYALAAFGIALFLRSRALTALMILLFAAQCAFFLFLPPAGLEGRCLPSRPVPGTFAKHLHDVNRWFLYYTAAQLRENDRAFGDLEASIRIALEDSRRERKEAMIVVPKNLLYHAGGSVCVNELYYRHIQFYFPRENVVVLEPPGVAFYGVRDYAIAWHGRKGRPVPLGGAGTVVIVAGGIDGADMPAGLRLERRGQVFAGDVSAIESFSFLGFTFSRK